MSNAIRRSLAICYHRFSDGLDLLWGRRNSLVPPQRLIHDGSTSRLHFESQFPTYLKEARQFGLKPHHKVLDVGCGNGKLGIVLTKYLTAEGGYDGFDIVAPAIDWCSKNITPKYPNFRFKHADVYNTHYNRQGQHKASEYIFPYKPETFDFVQLGSVFTHLVPESVDHYLAEIARVLKPSGICVISYYLLTPTSLKGLKQGWASPKFAFPLDSEACLVVNREDPEAIIAYDEDAIRSMYQKHRLQIEEPVIYGKWWWGDVNDQDMIKGSKEGA